MYEEHVMKVMVDGASLIIKSGSRVAMDCIAKYLAKREKWSEEQKMRELYRRNPYEAMLKQGRHARMIMLDRDEAVTLVDKLDKSGIQVYIQTTEAFPDEAVITFDAEEANIIGEYAKRLGFLTRPLEDDTRSEPEEVKEKSVETKEETAAKEPETEQIPVDKLKAEAEVETDKQASEVTQEPTQTPGYQQTEPEREIVDPENFSEARREQEEDLSKLSSGDNQIQEPLLAHHSDLQESNNKQPEVNKEAFKAEPSLSQQGSSPLSQIENLNKQTSSLTSDYSYRKSIKQEIAECEKIAEQINQDAKKIREAERIMKNALPR